MSDRKPHLLLIEARFYDDITDELVRGALAAIERAGASYELVTVPGALEIPAAVAIAASAANGVASRFDGYVALGCVIRGETGHYDIVAGESARGLMDLAVQRGLPVGNGILTVETHAQAWERARVDAGNKGGAAVDAALALVELAKRFKH
jgi:6,7-dimethyl-8-ribityllumazine synthase